MVSEKGLHKSFGKTISLSPFSSSHFINCLLGVGLGVYFWEDQWVRQSPCDLFRHFYFILDK